MKRSVFVLSLILFAVAALTASNAFAKKYRQANDWEYLGAAVVEDNPGLIHYKWETVRPPFGPFDQIALHRFVFEPNNKNFVPGRPAPDKKKVIFIIPGTWSQGSSKGSDPNVTTSYFLALNGYDVYSMDFRTKYIPDLAYGQFEELGVDISGTADWTYDLFREDIKACVDLTKKISRARKIFLGGRSRGATQMYIYASKYWKQDLKGLISLDGGIKGAPPISA